MFVVEIARSAHRLRTYVLAAALAAVAILPVVVVSIAPDQSGGGPPFVDLIRRAGLFAPLAAIGLIQPFFLPLGAGLLSGETIAAEAQAGTLRYLLVRPVGRVRLVLEKYAAVMVTLLAAVAWVILVGSVAGSIGFGFGPLPTLSGTTLGEGAALLRVLAAGLYVTAGMAGLVAIGVFISALTDYAPGATVATVSVAIASQILDGLSSLRAVHPYLLSHGWLAWSDLIRSPVSWTAMRQGLLVDAVYAVLFLALAVWWFGRRDVTS